MLDPQVTTAIFGVGFAATSAGLFAQTRAKRLLASRCAGLEKQHEADGTRIAALETEVRYFAEVTMPALVDVLARGHRGVPVPGLSQEQLVSFVETMGEPTARYQRLDGSARSSSPAPSSTTRTRP